MKNLLILILFISFHFGGCTTVADVRSMNADQSLESNKSPKQIADCVLYKAPAEVQSSAAYYHFTQSEGPPGTFHILAELPSQPAGEADFKPNGKGGTQIELRSRWNFWGKDSFWACIQRCASQNIPGK